MRYRHFSWILLCAWLGAVPRPAHADAPSETGTIVQEGDLHATQRNLQNTVRSDPQNATARYWLAKVDFDLGDVAAAETEARAALDRGFDPQQAVPLLAQTLLVQSKFQNLLNELRPDGQDALVDAQILVARGYAQLGLQKIKEAEASFALAEQTAPNAVEPLLANARLLASRGDLAGAEAKVDRAIAAQPKSPDALLTKAEILRARHDLTGALSVLDETIADQPGNLKAMLERADVLIATNQPGRAKPDIDAVLQATPGNVQAIYLHAVLEVEAKNYPAADAALDKIAAFIPRIARGYLLRAIVKEQLGQMDQAEAAARRYIANAPNDLAAYKVLARIEFVRRRPDLVIETLAKVAEPDHGDAEAFDLLGRAYAATDRGDDAVKAYQKAEALAPNDIGVQLRLTSVRMHMGQPEIALSELEHTLQLAPTQPQVGEALFFAALATGDMRKASDAIDIVRHAQGDTPAVGNLVGQLKLAQLDIDGAAAQFRNVVQNHPEFMPAKINLARVAAMQGNVGEAEQQLSEILAQNPTSEPALTMLVAQMMQSGRGPQAIAVVEKAHASQPANTHLTVSLGDFYIRAGKPAEALTLVDQDTSTANNVELLGLKAAAQMALGQKDQARHTYTQILELDPTLIAVRRQLGSLLLQAGDYERARSTIKEGLAANPSDYQLYQDEVMVDLKASGIDAALATADQLQQRDSNFQPARALKGDIYIAAERPADAVKAYQEALAAAPSSMLVYRLNAALLRIGDTAAATKLLTDWTAQRPEDLEAVQLLSDVDIATHRYDDAAKHLQVILSKKPHDPLALNNLAWLYQQLGDPRAEGLAQQAYILSPEGQTADTLGWILTSSGKLAPGIALLRQAASQASEDPRVLYHYAVALKDTGQRDAAIKLLNEVVANKAEFDEKADAQRLLSELTKG